MGGWNGLMSSIRQGFCAHRRPITTKFTGNLFVCNRPFLNNHIWCAERAVLSIMVSLHEFVASGDGQYGMVKNNFRKPRYRSCDELLYSWIFRANCRNRTSVTAQTCQPKSVNFAHRRIVQQEPRQITLFVRHFCFYSINIVAHRPPPTITDCQGV